MAPYWLLEDYDIQPGSYKIYKDSALVEHEKCLAGEKVMIARQTLAAESAPGFVMAGIQAAIVGVGFYTKITINTFNVDLPFVGPEEDN